jgi:hypothetical protein
MWFLPSWTRQGHEKATPHHASIAKPKPCPVVVPIPPCHRTTIPPEGNLWHAPERYRSVPPGTLSPDGPQVDRRACDAGSWAPLVEHAAEVQCGQGDRPVERVIGEPHAPPGSLGHPSLAYQEDDNLVEDCIECHSLLPAQPCRDQNRPRLRELLKTSSQVCGIPDGRVVHAEVIAN